ncbi:hypothetical protein [Fulvivirga lutea]|uniref:Uncharacterized protein n=1 Tax=Fulvivirga lutea TaxID=2810512 RepID=A0A975A0L3_9BACT|nr:hypothetical protein [Fulvivirga lutea]QSE97386.1 hypothetical protein JR347_17670 [Fulvivirga lutea]
MILGLALTLSLQAFGQVEHNFEMGPENTDCHELQLTGEFQNDISLIRKSTFRVHEEMKVSRYHIPSKVEYFSCDGAVGYLIATEKDSLKVYSSIRKTLWDSLTNTPDPIQFYKDYFIDE